MLKLMSVLAACVALLVPVALVQGATYIDPDKAQADPDFAIQGEYSGEVQRDEGAQKFGVQVIALGKGQFRAVGYPGGLPGDGWDGQERIESDGQLKEGQVRFAGEDGAGVVRDGVLTVTDSEGRPLGKLERLVRKSPTLGKQAPEGAVVLFDGTSVEKWENGRMEDGLLMEGTTSKPRFGSHKVHLEFLLPFQPEARGQGRGNSGIYVQGRYEVQMLDSFGLEGKHNECGGIYSVKDPDVNMCLPPLVWQTYDIDYTAGKYDEQGKLVENPRVTVRHNGVLIHENVELPGERSTTAAPLGPGPEPGPVYLQNHGNPVRYRNIWVLEK